MLDNIYEWSFGTIQNFKYELMLEDMGAEEADALKKELDGELIMTTAIIMVVQVKNLSEEKIDEKADGYGVPCVLDTDAKNKLEKYCHLGMRHVATRKLAGDCYLYDLMKEV